MNYVDGLVLAVPRKNLPACVRIPKAMPFDVRRMVDGGFRIVVDGARNASREKTIRRRTGRLAA